MLDLPLPLAIEDTAQAVLIFHIFLLMVGFLCWKNKKTSPKFGAKSFPTVAFIKLRDFNLSFPLCSSHLDLSLKENLTCAVGMHWFAREKSKLVKRLKSWYQRWMRYMEQFLLYASILHLITVNQHYSELNPFHEHVDWEFIFRAKSILFPKANTLQKTITQMEDTVQGVKCMSAVLKFLEKFSVFAFCRP